MSRLVWTIKIFLYFPLSFEDLYEMLKDVFYDIEDNLASVHAKIITEIYDEETKLNIYISFTYNFKKLLITLNKIIKKIKIICYNLVINIKVN